LYSIVVSVLACEYTALTTATASHVNYRRQDTLLRLTKRFCTHD